MKMRLYLLFVAVLLAPVLAHGAGFPALGHLPAAARDTGALVPGTSSPSAPHTGNLSEHRLILAHGNIVSQSKAAETGPDLDLRYVDWDSRKAGASARSGDVGNGKKAQADDENGNDDADDEDGGDEEEDKEEEEEGGWDRLWDSPKLG
jgi:hypothetical protein